MRLHRFALVLAALLAAAPPLVAQRPARPAAQAAPRTEADLAASTVSGLRLRSIGPAVTSGRVVALAVDPRTRSRYFVGAASGGVWKTENAGVSWTPVFDREGSYSIGALAIDPKNPSVVWVGTGENNNQRSVSYGDGIYRSDDGGASWKNMGLKASEHIGRILIDPRDSDVVYVAATGPLWGPGGDRGLFKTTDGGKTWNAVLKISEHTGVTDAAMDPRNPDVLLAAAHQRRRHYFTLIHGGPESALYRSTDAGASWTKITQGLPTEELGRIGIAMAPANPDIVYAWVEAANSKGGIFRSANGGVTWDKRNDFDSGAMYYGIVFVDPVDVDRIYVPSVFLQVSDDGGRTLRNLGERFKHVDNHVIWVDPADPSYYLVGCDGGLYESFDRGATWQFKANLPITQFYDVTADNGAPFYHVYGGTQDNYSLGGPARTRSRHGILNQDWFVTQNGDGFVSRVDPEDPDTVYAEMQHGGLVRYQRRSGERIGIQPQPGRDDPPARWNWDSPLIISPHSRTRLYFGAERLYRSDDRGSSWRIVSPDLSRQLDRDELEVMGRIWSADAVGRHVSTAFYGNISAIAESQKKEDLLYVGTDDGLVQVSEDGGKTWRRIDRLPGVPEHAYVSRIVTSVHDADTVFVTVDNHQNADFTPYVLRSADRGRSWQSIAGNLPPRGSVYAFAEDHVERTLLFAGTEFGLFFTRDGGTTWIGLTGGLPTIAVRDLAIQRRENDLVVGTFGRGIYVLDDYRPLRSLSKETLAREAMLFPVKDALLYIETAQYGLRGKAFLGETLYQGDNPLYGAVFTYYLRDGLETAKERRQREEREAAAAGRAAAHPSREQLRAEADEEAPAVLITVTDASGKPVRTLIGPVGKGFQRVAWDLRVPAPELPRPPRPQDEENLFQSPPVGPFAIPGEYRVSIGKRVAGVITELSGPVAFTIVLDPQSSTTAEGLTAHAAFQTRLVELSRVVLGALGLANETATRLEAIKRALDQTPGAPKALHERTRALERRVRELLAALRGDEALARRNEPVPVSISERVDNLRSDLSYTLQAPTRAHEGQYELARTLFDEQNGRLKALVSTDLPALERDLEAAGAPWTPGRVPR